MYAVCSMQSTSLGIDTNDAHSLLGARTSLDGSLEEKIHLNIIEIKFGLLNLIKI